MSPRRWLIPLAALAIAIAPALASTAASASTHSGALAIQNGGTDQHVIMPGTARARRAQWPAQRDLEYQLVRLRRRQRHLYQRVSQLGPSPPAPARRRLTSTPASGSASTDTAATASSRTAPTLTA